MPDVVLGWFCLLLSMLGGGLGREISYLGVEWLVTPIWDVLAPQGEQERALNRLKTGSISRISQLGKQCHLGFLKLWVATGFVFHSKNNAH